MKKFALMLALALPVVMASCSDDPKTVTLDQTSINLVYGNTEQLTSSEKKTEWSSNNPFVATVDDKGFVTAKHVGEAIITAAVDDAVATCKVTVTPLYTNYVFPCLQWGANQATVKEAVKGFELDPTSTATQLKYWTNLATYAYPAYSYLFNGTGALYTSSLIVDADEDSAVNNWLLQYYEDVTTDATDAIAAYKYENQYLELDFLGDNLDNVIVTWVAPASLAAPAVRSGNVFVDAKAAAADMIKNRK